MSLCAFGDNLFLEHKSKWFLWESAWDSFRPITSVYWDGYTFVIDDRAFCTDPTDELYGYGSQELKDLCERLNELQSQENIRTFDTPEIGPLTWFRDRFVSISACTLIDKRSWRNMHRGKYHTCRKAPKGSRRTRRLDKKDL